MFVPLIINCHLYQSMGIARALTILLTFPMLHSEVNKDIGRPSISIKGACEHCGFAYKGDFPKQNGRVMFFLIKCPKCGLRTDNFDETYLIDRLEKIEGFHFDYAESVFEIIRD